MAIILPLQSCFDKAIPDNFGNAEYRAERELLMTLDGLIGQINSKIQMLAQNGG